MLNILMYVCEVCKKEFKCHQQLNGHKQTHRKSKKQIEYELNPKQCKECNQTISWKSYRFHKQTIEFCCVSCRAKFFYKKCKNIEEN
jgi:hypothetical protein